MIDASKLLAFANKLEDDYKEQGYKWLYDKLRYEIVRQNQTELNNNEVLGLISEPLFKQSEVKMICEKLARACTPSATAT